MGLPFGKKRPQVAEEKKDLKQNYTTDDHKTDLDDLLRSLNSDASKVGTALEGARQGGGDVEAHRQAGVARLCSETERSGRAIKLLVVLCCNFRARQQNSGACGGNRQPLVRRVRVEYANGSSPRPRLRCNLPRVVALLIPAAGPKRRPRIQICSPCVSVNLRFAFVSEIFCSLGI